MKIRLTILSGIGLACLMWAKGLQAYDPWMAGQAGSWAGGHAAWWLPNAAMSYGGYGYGGGGGQTAVSANLTGMSNLVRAQGQYNDATSRAMINVEQARRTYIENEKSAYSALLTVQRMTRAEDMRRRETELENEARGNQFAEAHKPAPLRSSQYDASSGQIAWPAALNAKMFDEQRKGIEELTAAHARYPEDATVSAKAKKAISDLRDSLRSQIQTIQLAEYTESRRFLESLASSLH